MRILFFVKEPLAVFDVFKKAAAQLGVVMEMALYEDVVIEYSNDKVVASVKKTPLDSYDLVAFRTVGDEVEMATIISRYCQDKKIQLTDSVFYHQNPWIDTKSFEYIALQKNKIPIIPSFFISVNQLPQLKNKINYPLVAKVTTSSMGKDVTLCHSEKELKKIFKNHPKLLVQEFINNNSYYRLFVINGQLIATIKRTKDPKKFGETIPVGSKAEKYTLDKESQKMAIKAAQALNYDIAGVDLIKDEAGKIYIIEVNRAPQFKVLMKTTGINITKKIIEFWISLIKNHD